MHTANGSITLPVKSHVTSKYVAQSHLFKEKLFHLCSSPATNSPCFPSKQTNNETPVPVRAVCKAQRRHNYQLSTTGWLQFRCHGHYKSKTYIQ